MNSLMPEVAAWYQDVISGNMFEVVAIDAASGTIEYQLIDGEVGEYDRTTWQTLHIAAAEAPEDWRTPYELNQEDQIYSDQTLIPENFSHPLANIEPDLLDLGDDFQIL